MNVQFLDIDRKGLQMTEVAYNGRLVYIVPPNSDSPAFRVVNPFVLAPPSEFTTFDAASTFAASILLKNNND
jgi:hypothetical protein